MDASSSGRIVRRVRKKLEVSQEGLARLLNATKGAIQHWERGRNNPDLARLNALRQLCPPSPERRALDALIKQTQARVAPLPTTNPRTAKQEGSSAEGASLTPGGNYVYLRRENQKLHLQVSRLEALVQRRTEQLRILEDLATELQRDLAKLRAEQPAARSPVPESPAAAKD